MPRAARDKITGLTKSEEAFCQYLIGHDKCNDSDAYRHAYNCANKKPATVNKRASELKNKGHIQARIALLKAERSERTNINADYVLQRLVEIDQLDVADILNDDHSLKPVREWPKAWRLSISAIDIKQLESADPDIEAILKKIKWPDKLKNLELMGKHVEVKAFEERINVNVDHAEILDAARKRAAKAKK